MRWITESLVTPSGWHCWSKWYVLLSDWGQNKWVILWPSLATDMMIALSFKSWEKHCFVSLQSLPHMYGQSLCRHVLVPLPTSIHPAPPPSQSLHPLERRRADRLLLQKYSVDRLLLQKYSVVACRSALVMMNTTLAQSLKCLDVRLQSQVKMVVGF